MSYEELSSLSNRELIDMEDTLLLEQEMDSQVRFRYSGGRLVLLVLTAMIWLLLAMIFASKITQVAIKTKYYGIASIAGFFLSFGLAIFLSQLIWRKAGVSTRVFIRNAVHYWPVTFYFIMALILFLKS